MSAIISVGLLVKRREDAENMAARVNADLMRERFEPGTKEAFYAYVSCLRQLYLFGMAMQLKRMGNHMERTR